MHILSRLALKNMKRGNFLIAIPLLLVGMAFTYFSNVVTASKSECSVNSVYDGDTMRLSCNGEKTKVRLYCIDTPEMKQKPWGRESRDYLRSITPQKVKLVRHTKDRYGRIVAEVLNGEINLNQEMVHSGYAAVYEKYCEKPIYSELERQAKSDKRGIWAKPGLHQQPWQWRKQQRKKKN